MRYEVTEYIGDMSKTHDYEGTPEEIAKLISLVKNESADPVKVGAYEPYVGTIRKFSGEEELKSVVKEMLDEQFRKIKDAFGGGVEDGRKNSEKY
jgi:molybdopterin synthase catalytic subunit